MDRERTFGYRFDFRRRNKMVEADFLHKQAATYKYNYFLRS